MLLVGCQAYVYWRIYRVRVKSAGSIEGSALWHMWYDPPITVTALLILNICFLSLLASQYLWLSELLIQAWGYRLWAELFHRGNMARS